MRFCCLKTQAEPGVNGERAGRNQKTASSSIFTGGAIALVLYCLHWLFPAAWRRQSIFRRSRWITGRLPKTHSLQHLTVPCPFRMRSLERPSRGKHRFHTELHGGGLCASAAMKLRDMGESMPAGLALISPRVDHVLAKLYRDGKKYPLNSAALDRECACRMQREAAT